MTSNNVSSSEASKCSSTSAIKSASSVAVATAPATAAAAAGTTVTTTPCISADSISITNENVNTSISTCFVIPNERHPEAWWKDLKSVTGGTLVSVGSIRPLIAASMGNFSRIVMLDIDQRINQFNKINIELISNISSLPLPPNHQRYQYLAALNKTWFSAEDLEEIESAFKQKHSADQEMEMVKNKLEKLSLYDEEIVFPLEKNLATSILQCSVIDNQFTLEAFLYYGPKSTINEKNINFNYFTWPDSREAKFYWENDDTWSKIIKLVRDKKIHVVNGSLTGNQSIKSLGNILQSRGEYISVLDISNCLLYFKGDTSILKDFLMNLKLLGEKKCLDKRSKIFFTNRKLQLVSDSIVLKFNGWLYRSCEWTVFYKNLKKHGREQGAN